MSRGVVLWVWVVAGAALAAGGPRAPAALRLFAAAAYDVDTTVLLNDATRNDRELGYKIKAALDVAPVWAHHHAEFLLRFQLHSPKLHLRGKHVNAEFLPHESVWDSHQESTFYAHWKNGIIETVYLDPDELTDILNYKRSLASLFQFQVLDGEYNETDVSGACAALYETVSTNVFRKIKRRCSEDGAVVVGARRVARYTLSADLDALDALHADELLTLGDAALGLKARAWQALARRAPPAAGAPPPAADLRAAVAALPAALRPHTLALAPAPPDVPQLDDDELIQFLETMPEDDAAEAEGAGGAGIDGAAAAGALLRVLPALRAAPRARLAALLASDAARPHLAALVRALGAAGTRAAHGAAAALLQLGARDVQRRLARLYLAALSLSPQPDEWVVLEVLKLGEEARAADVAHAALLAAGAGAARRAAAGAPGAAELGAAVRAALARSLARCRDDDARAARLQALGNLRRDDTVDLLLEHALRGANGSAAPALAAVEALGALSPSALTFSRLDRLTELALDARAALELRAAALDLVVVRRAALPAPLTPLARLAHELQARGPHELRRVLWQRLAALAPQHEAVARLPAMLPRRLRGWDAQAHSGTSSVLLRETGWRAGAWAAALESVQLARAGLLRRGAVALRAAGAPGAELHVLSVAVWTRGLQAFGGGEAPPDEPPEEAAGGLALAVGGARMPDIALFDGQAELLGHVWAGTASAPTAVLRALQPLRDVAGAPPLQAGVRLRARAAAALALALDAAAQVSLWHRSARADLALRAGAAALVEAELRTAWGEVAARALTDAAPRLRIGADLDFYSAVALCVRARTDAHALRRRVELRAALGGARGGARGARRLRRAHAAVTAAPGRTLALGRPNDAVCRTLRSAEADDDAA